MNIKDCKGRNIGERIIAIKYGDIKYPYYITGKELFRFQDSVEYTVDRFQSESINSNYYAWQNLEHGPYWIPDYLHDDHGINECGVDKHSISEVGYWEEFYNRKLKIQFIKDEKNWLNVHPFFSYKHSTEVKRLLLKAHGFEYCGTRKFWKPFDEKREIIGGFIVKDRGAAIWIHPETGVAVTYTVGDSVLFNDPKIIHVIENRDGFNLFSRPSKYISSMRCEERRDGLGYMGVTQYRSGPNIPWGLHGTNRWNLGMEGFHRLYAFDWDEFEFKNEDQYWETRNKMGQEFVALAEEYPLLKQVVF